MLRFAARALLLVLAVGCGAPDPILTVDELRPTLSDDPTCTPAAPPDRIELRALGDFPAAETDRFVAVWTAAQGRTAFDRFPLDTRVVTLRTSGGWEGAGVFPVPNGDAVAPVLLLPLGRSCGSSDSAVAAPEGSAVAPLPDGGMLIVGGASAETRLVRVHAPGGAPAEVLPESLFGRVGATATPIEGAVIVAGGSSEPSFDVFDVAAGALDRDAAGRLPVAVRAHGAVALGDGRVLIAGGEDVETGEPIRGAAIVAPGEATATGALTWARVEPELVRLDDGRVFVAGGTLRGGALAASLEHYDEAAGTWGEVEGGLEMDPPAAGCTPEGVGAAVALPGARIAWLAPCAERIQLRLFVGRDALDPIEAETRLDAPLPPRIGAESIAVLADGDIMLGGRLAGAGRRVIVDPGTGQVRTLADAAPVDRLVTLADGSIAELRLEGSGVRREDVRTPWDNPPATLLPTDTDWLALDAGSRWAAGGERVLVLPTLRFADVRLTTISEGPVDLVLRDDAGSEVRVVLDPERAEVGLCALAHDAGSELTVTRRGRTVVLAAGGEEKRCDVTLEGRVSLAWKLYETTAALRIERL